MWYFFFFLKEFGFLKKYPLLFIFWHSGEGNNILFFGHTLQHAELTQPGVEPMSPAVEAES